MSWFSLHFGLTYFLRVWLLHFYFFVLTFIFIYIFWCYLEIFWRRGCRYDFFCMWKIFSLKGKWVLVIFVVVFLSHFLSVLYSHSLRLGLTFYFSVHLLVLCREKWRGGCCNIHVVREDSFYFYYFYYIIIRLIFFFSFGSIFLCIF